MQFLFEHRERAKIWVALAREGHTLSIATKTRSTDRSVRYPPNGIWPGQMRADLTAAYLDYRDTKELAAAVRRREAPAPDALRGKGRKREPVWSLTSLERFIAPTAEAQQYRRPAENLASLI